VGKKRTSEGSQRIGGERRRELGEIGRNGASEDFRVRRKNSRRKKATRAARVNGELEERKKDGSQDGKGPRLREHTPMTLPRGAQTRWENG